MTTAAEYRLVVRGPDGMRRTRIKNTTDKAERSLAAMRKHLSERRTPYAAGSEAWLETRQVTPWERRIDPPDTDTEEQP